MLINTCHVLIKLINNTFNYNKMQLYLKIKELMTKYYFKLEFKLTASRSRVKDRLYGRTRKK